MYKPFRKCRSAIRDKYRGILRMKEEGRDFRYVWRNASAAKKNTNFSYEVKYGACARVCS